MNDKREPVGLADADRLLVDRPNKIQGPLGLVVPVRALIKQGKELIEVVVEASPMPISYRGEHHVRSGSTKQQLTGHALSTFLLRKFGRHPALADGLIERTIPDKPNSRLQHYRLTALGRARHAGRRAGG